MEQQSNIQINNITSYLRQILLTIKVAYRGNSTGQTNMEMRNKRNGERWIYTKYVDGMMATWLPYLSSSVIQLTDFFLSMFIGLPFWLLKANNTIFYLITSPFSIFDNQRQGSIPTSSPSESISDPFSLGYLPLSIKTNLLFGGKSHASSLTLMTFSLVSLFSSAMFFPWVIMSAVLWGRGEETCALCVCRCVCLLWWACRFFIWWGSIFHVGRWRR